MRIETIGNAALYLGDCLEVLRTMPDCSVDSIVTDPPYGLKFMGKAWDYEVPPEEVWRECLRVLKPGGHLLCFAGTRTQHRMAVRIEDAGFEIRDMIAWVYGSGFPKSLDVSKAIDKAMGAERTERLAPKAGHENFVGRDNMKALRESGALSGEGGFSRPWMHDPQKVEDAHWDFAPATPEAQRWEGWGTALKPALEPITVARKPLADTVAANVRAHGTGALNIDGCRVGGNVDEMRGRSGTAATPGGDAVAYRAHNADGGVWEPNISGRWPANLIHDGSEEVLAGFPMVKGGTAVRRNSGGNTFGGCRPKPTMGDMGYDDSGSAARFFYCAKASKADRDEGLDGLAERKAGSLNMRTDSHSERNGMTTAPRRNTHPTVKPTALMRYLCRLVTPPGGTVLDPFTGSGSTGKAARLEGFAFIGIERESNYFDIACRRIAQRQGRLIA